MNQAGECIHIISMQKQYPYIYKCTVYMHMLVAVLCLYTSSEYTHHHYNSHILTVYCQFCADHII